MQTGNGGVILTAAGPAIQRKPACELSKVPTTILAGTSLAYIPAPDLQEFHYALERVQSRL